MNFPYLHRIVEFRMKSLLAFFLCFIWLTEVQGWRHGHHGTRRVRETITVDQRGRGNFTSIQAAIDSVTPDHPHWTCIRVRPGIYREHVRVDKPYLLLKGSGRARTKVVYNDKPNMLLSATLAVVTDNFVAKGISFINSRNLPQYGGDPSQRSPAAAAYIRGDKCSFHRCGFFGVQDTLWDVQGRHYYHQTTIVGSVDFIFGNGQSIFEKSVIYVLGGVLPEGLAGYITAHARGSPTEETAFIFKECSIIGGANVYLGRPWGKYARVLYYKTTMSDIVVPQGWDVWFTAGDEKSVTFAQDQCTGPGANTTERVPWEKKLSKNEIQKLTSLDFINSDKWINVQPINFI